MVNGGSTAISTTRTNQSTPPVVQHDHTVLLLQGGGALGAYQAGVYEGMHEEGFAPDWVTGVSIGAINAALIAGNPPGKRLELQDDPDYKALAPFAEYKRQITVAHLINRRVPTSINAKDYEFSRATIRQLWEVGLDDVPRACARREWLEAREVVSGVRVFDLSA